MVSIITFDPTKKSIGWLASFQVINIAILKYYLAEWPQFINQERIRISSMASRYFLLGNRAMEEPC